MTKYLRDPSRNLGAKAAAHWRKLEDLDRIYMAERAREMENPAVSVPAHTTAGQTPKSRKDLGTW